MMKNILKYSALLMAFPLSLSAQETVYPAKAQSEKIVLTNGIIHVGNGQVINNGSIAFENGKIVQVGMNITGGGKMVDLEGKHVYPGMILPITNLGLVEVSSVRATSDASELGDNNSNIRSIVAYNTDSKVINTLRHNGILLANIVPQGGSLSGSSSVVQLDAWNWEDAAYKTDFGIHFRMPNLIVRPNPFAALLGLQAPQGDPVKQALDRIEGVKDFFRQAKAYSMETSHIETNLKFEAVKGLFNKNQKLFIHCEIVKQMLVAVDFVKEFGFDVVIVGGTDSYKIADILKQNNIAVILGQSHGLPTLPDDDVDQPYKTPAMLQKAGVLFAINDDDGQTRGRNLPFNAGTAAAYGLSKEEALAAVTLNAAKILGVGDKTGSLEVGKDANIVISDGDMLDMRGNIISGLYIQGRELNLTDKHKQLFDRYKYKYSIK